MSKLVTCKVCGANIAKNAKTCPSCGAPRKKSAARIVFGIIIAVFGFLLLFSAVSSSSGKKEDTRDLVTLENFNKIDSSMSYDDVCALFGKEGTLDSEVDIAGIVTQIYHWNNKTNLFNCTVTFQNGKMVAKTQIGLK